MTDETTDESSGTMGKPRSKGLINASPIDLVPRHVGRISRLRLAIAAETAADDPDTARIAEMQQELDERLAQLQEARALLDEV